MTIFYSFLLNFALVLVGYLTIGSLNTAILLAKWIKKDDIRNYHSANAGATNSIRTYGKAFGITVFFIDLLKVYLPTLILSILINQFFKNFATTYFISPQTLALGIIIGHIYPIYFQFKGGKGVACTIGLFLSINLILALSAILIFIIVVLIFRMVSLASLLSILLVTILTFIPWMTQGILGFYFNNLTLNNSFINLNNYWYVSGIITVFATFLVWFSHRSNLKRIIQKSERKIRLFKK